jgi:DNA mismatch repair protein MutS
MFSQKLVTRYNELKRQAPDCILLMQVGTFMQVMNEDAQIVSDLTQLKLQISGDVGAEPVIMGGFPQSGLDKYIMRLIRAGHSVAIALQDETKQRHIEEILRVQRTLPRQQDKSS